MYLFFDLIYCYVICKYCIYNILLSNLLHYNTSCLQSYEMLMSRTSLIYAKSTQIENLISPMPVVMHGLSDIAKVPTTLDAITETVKYHSSVNVLTTEFTGKVKECLEQHWKQGSKVSTRFFI